MGAVDYSGEAAEVKIHTVNHKPVIASSLRPLPSRKRRRGEKEDLNLSPPLSFRIIRAPIMWRILLLSLVPGPAQIQSGKPGRGILCFSLFLFFLNGYFIAPFVVSFAGLQAIALAMTGVVWILALLDAIRIRRQPPPSTPVGAKKTGKIYERSS